MAHAAAAGEESAADILRRRAALEHGERRWKTRAHRVSARTSTTPDRVVELEIFDQLLDHGEARTAVFVRAPADVAGRGYLAFQHPDRLPEVRYFSPTIKKLRGLGAYAALERLEQTDLTYGDLDLLHRMQRWGADDVTGTLRGSEPIDGTTTWVLELTPTRPTPGGKRIVVWLGQADFVARRVELYDDEGTTIRRRVTQRRIEPAGAIPVPREVEFESLQAKDGSRTVLTVQEIRFDVPIGDDLFQEDAFTRRIP